MPIHFTGRRPRARVSRCRAACVSHLRTDVEDLLPAEGSARRPSSSTWRSHGPQRAESDLPRASSCPAGVVR
jgi:hypothetical protein